MNIIFFGPPGAGKGTQAEIVSKRLAIPTISTGAILREAISKGTECGLAAKSYIESGALVPDEVVIGILKDRLAEDDCKNGFILDGFPRTVLQAEALDAMNVKIDVVLSLEVSDDTIVERLGGRRLCSSCGNPYHVKYNPPKSEGKCDKCGADLIIRKDDDPRSSRAVLLRITTRPNRSRPIMKRRACSKRSSVRRKLPIRPL